MERMESGLINITDRRDTERVIINGVSLTHTEAIHLLLVQISDMERENGHGVTTHGQEEADKSAKTIQPAKTKSSRYATRKLSSRARKSR